MKPEWNIAAIHCCILFGIMQVGEVETVEWNSGNDVGFHSTVFLHCSYSFFINQTSLIFYFILFSQVPNHFVSISFTKHSSLFDSWHRFSRFTFDSAVSYSVQQIFKSFQNSCSPPFIWF